MIQSERIEKAKSLLAAAHGQTMSPEKRSQVAVELAALMLQEAQATQTAEEKEMQAQLSRMMQDPKGKLFTTCMTDQCFRSNDTSRVADQLTFLLKKFGIPRFLSGWRRFQLFVFKWLGKPFHAFLVPLVREMLYQETSRVILPGEPEEMTKHLKERREEGVRINLNHLGEAILGEEEAKHRLNVYLEDIANPEIEYISVKISTICSQLNLLAWEDTLKVITERLITLYRATRKHLYKRRDGKVVPKFINLDMEEYKDLHLTVEAFRCVLDIPEFHTYSAGIVLQSYLPDSYLIQQQLTAWAQQRVLQGGAPIKIRIVKGANLAMEKIEASTKGWPQAPYDNKNAVDANFKRMVIYGCDRERTPAVHLGIGSHNLFDIAYAMLLREENGVKDFVGFEMLEGMADHMRRVIQQLTQDMLLYCPIATRDEFQNAIAYLIRRLDENTGEENFLRYSFGLTPNSEAWKEQVALFSKACQAIALPNNRIRRTQDRSQEPVKPHLNLPFENEPDTDWSLPQNRQWVEQILREWKSRKLEPIPLVIGGKQYFTKSKMGTAVDPSFPDRTLYQYSLAENAHLEQALQAAKHNEKKWSETSIADRSALLAEVAQNFRKHRSDLIGAMVADTGKVIPEADVEVSEAIDFAEYYRRTVEEVIRWPDILWQAKGTVLVAPPWNFPCSIPAGGILAALAAGNCVIFKPASESVLVGWELVQLFWKSGISKEVLQFITCEDEPIGSQLIQDPRINCVLLTGATSTAKLFLNLRPGLDLSAETGGKNAIIITSLADRDLAVKDVVQSAFGHSGQKCSACSLLICESEVYDDPHFRKQLRDAASSLSVGTPWDPATRVNPLIREPNPTLKRALTSLEKGEEWLLEPREDPTNPNLWSPGIKLGVKPGSFTYQNELFGPVLGVMRANDLRHAIQLANGTAYGLTSGLHSLDEREQRYWIKHIEAGNCYINRGITGAIVQRQPFGGCKESSFGDGAKAGGPNYVMQLMHPTQRELPKEQAEPRAEIKSLSSLLSEYSSRDKKEWLASIGSYAYFWRTYFCKSHDPSHILGQDNKLQYVPHRNILLRIQKGDSLLNIFRAIAAAATCGCPLEISCEAAFTGMPSLAVTMETEQQLIERLKQGKIKRVRLLSQPSSELQGALARASCNVNFSLPMANGRVELLKYLREVSISFDFHRYGFLGRHGL